jgi:hypothetical protein
MLNPTVKLFVGSQPTYAIPGNEVSIGIGFLPLNAERTENAQELRARHPHLDEVTPCSRVVLHRKPDLAT